MAFSPEPHYDPDTDELQFLPSEERYYVQQVGPNVEYFRSPMDNRVLGFRVSGVQYLEPAPREVLDDEQTRVAEKPLDSQSDSRSNP